MASISNDKWFFWSEQELRITYPNWTDWWYATVSWSVYIWSEPDQDWKNKAWANPALNKYTWASPTNTTVWWLVSWTDISWKTYTEIIEKMVVSYLLPAFSSFVMSWQSTTIEVWETISWTKTFTWWTSNSWNVQTNSIIIKDATQWINLVTGIANDWSESVWVWTIQKISSSSHTWRIQWSNTQAWIFTRDFSVSWQWRKYYWESISAWPLVESDIEWLRVWWLSSWFAWTYSYNAWWYKYIAYPTSFWTATSFKDQSTNLDVPFEVYYLVDITNINWITTQYKVHRTTNVLWSAINIIIS